MERIIEFAIVFGVVSLLVLAVVVSVKSSKDFSKVCTEANGKVVSDGRQRQCIKQMKLTNENN